MNFVMRICGLAVKTSRQIPNQSCKHWQQQMHYLLENTRECDTLCIHSKEEVHYAPVQRAGCEGYSTPMCRVGRI